MKVKFENGLKTQRMGEKITGFINTNTVNGKATKASVVKKFGLTESKSMAPKYVSIGGVPHKMVGGKFVSLTKV